MHSGAKVFLVGVFGVFAGWLFLFIFCSIPGISGSNACGHNAAMLFPFAYLMGAGACWLALNKIIAISAKRRQEDN